MAIVDDLSWERRGENVLRSHEWEKGSLPAIFIDLIVDMSAYMLKIHQTGVPSTRVVNKARERFHKRAVVIGKRARAEELESAGKDAAINQLQAQLQQTRVDASDAISELIDDVLK